MSHCVQRNYVAEDVKLYTWRMVTENRGVELVGQYISQVSEGIVCSLQTSNRV